MPDIKNQITIGNLLQIGTMLVVVALAWATLDARTTAFVQSVADHETRLRKLEVDVLAGLTRIDGRLARIEGSSRP